jgi:hypothetical protein
MESIYAECHVLRQKFIEEETKKLPDYFFTREDGGRFLRPEAFDSLQKRADEYYQQCLDERSIRIPKQ